MRSVALPLLILVCAIVAWAQTPAGAPDAKSPEAQAPGAKLEDTSIEGRTIVNIVPVPAEQPMLQAEFDQRLGLRIGAPLSLTDVRAERQLGQSWPKTWALWQVD